MGHKLEGKRSREILAESSPDSNTQIQRLIRLNELLPEIRQMVDEGKMALRPAVEISYLSQDEQASLLQTMQIDEVTPSLAQSIEMKKISKEGLLNEDRILSIMSEEKPNQVEQLKIPRDRLSKYFPSGTPVEKIQDTIFKALDLWLQRQRNRDAR